MKVEIWSDVVCPWCAIGKRRFESALAQFPHADRVEVVWRSFELDPAAPAELDVDLVDHLAGKYGTSRSRAQEMQDSVTAAAAQEGLEFRLDIARSGNTFDAHRLLHLARERGLQQEMKERLLHAYFTEGELVSDHASLARLAGQVGLDDAEAANVLAAGGYAHDVHDDELRARTLGIRGVPFFVIDWRYGVSGAQPSEALLDVLVRAWAEANPLVVIDDDPAAGACSKDSCATV